MSGNFADWIKYYSISGLAAKIANIEKVIGTLPNTDNPILNGTVTVLDGPVIVDNQAGNARSVVYTSSGTPRWLVGADDTPESGNNEGSDFVVQSYKDNGDPNQQTLTISRTDGTVALTARPSWGDGAGGVATPWDSSNLDLTQYETTAAAAIAAQVAADATAAAIVTAGDNAADLYVPLANPHFSTGVTITDNGGTAPGLTLSAISNAVGALIGLLGDGVTTAAKFLQVHAGHFRILANDQTTPLLDIDDSGNADFSGAVTALAFPNANLSGTPTAPTAAAGDNSTAVATTAFVTAAVAGGGGGPGGPYETVADAQVMYGELTQYTDQAKTDAITQAGINANAALQSTAAGLQSQINLKAPSASPVFTNSFQFLGSGGAIFGAPSGASVSITLANINLARWALQTIGTESGNNTGSDLALIRSDDSGNPNATSVMQFTRSTGAVAFALAPTWNNGAIPWDSQNLNPSSFVPVTSPVFNNGVGAPTSLTAAATFTSTASPSVGQVAIYPSLPAAAYNTLLVQAGDAGIFSGADSSNPAGYTQGFVVGRWDLDGNTQGIRIGPSWVEVSKLQVLGSTQLAGRPTFGPWTPWDSGNLDPTTFLTSATAAATYVPIVGGKVTGPLQFNGSGTNFRGIAIMSTSLTTPATTSVRWNVGTDIADGGSNTGSDLRFYRYDDNGIWLGTALNIIRSTGVAQFSTRPQWLVNGVWATPWDSSNLDPSNVPTNVNPTFTNNSSTFGPSSSARFVNGTSPATRSIAIFPGAGSTNYGNVIQQGDNAIVSNADLPGLASLAITPANVASSRTVGLRMTPAPAGTYVPGSYDLQFYGYPIFDSPVLFSSSLAVNGNATFGAAANFGVRPTFAGNTPWDTGNLPGSTANGSTTFSNVIVIPNGVNVTGGKYNSSYLSGITTFDGGVAFSENAAVAMNGPQLALSAGTILTAAGTCTFNGATSFSQAATFTTGFKVNAGTSVIAGTLNVSAATNFTGVAQFSAGAGFVSSPVVPTANDAANGPGSNIAASTLYVQQALAAQALPKKGFNYEIQFPWTTPTQGNAISGSPPYAPPMSGYPSTGQWYVQAMVTVGTTCVLQGGLARSWTVPANDYYNSYITLWPSESYGSPPTIPDGTNFTNVVALFEWEQVGNNCTASQVNNNITIDPGDTLILWAPYPVDARGISVSSNLSAISVVLNALAVVS